MQVCIDLDVYDPQAVLQAAITRALAEGAAKTAADASTMLAPGGDIDLTACLNMLLDPGSLPGVSINELTVDY